MSLSSTIPYLLPNILPLPCRCCQYLILSAGSWFLLVSWQASKRQRPESRSLWYVSDHQPRLCTWNETCSLKKRNDECSCSHHLVKRSLLREVAFSKWCQFYHQRLLNQSNILFAGPKTAVLMGLLNNNVKKMKVWDVVNKWQWNKFVYSSKGQKTGLREASLEGSKNASQTVLTTELTMVDQCVFAELVSTQKDLPANKEHCCQPWGGARG